MWRLLFGERRRERRRNSFYQTPAWIRLREACKAENMKFFGSPVPKCERCLAHSKHLLFWKRRKIHVDHIKPRSKFPALALDPANCQALCSVHNLRKGARLGMPNWKAWRRCWIRRWFVPIKRIWARSAHGYW